MFPIKISLCITTKDRFETFLDKSLEKYVAYLDEDIIDEIVICDENGNDYDKILDKYGKFISENKLRVYKNEKILGVFLNKLKVCKLAKNEYVSLIDSDNFADDIYFKVAKKYIEEKNITKNCIVAPSYPRYHFTCMRNEYSGFIFTKSNCKDHVDNTNFGALINMGNYIFTKNILDNLVYDENLLPKIHACDVMYFNLLLFQQVANFEMHMVPDMEYDHRVHENCVSIETYRECDETKYHVVMPQFYYL
jgi:hypothetical protein